MYISGQFPNIYSRGSHTEEGSLHLEFGGRDTYLEGSLTEKLIFCYHKYKLNLFKNSA